MEQDDLEGALTLLETRAGDAEADALRAALYQRQERHVEAGDLYSTLVGRDASRPTWWMGLGLSLEALGHHRRAVAAYRKASALGPLDGAARAWLGERIAALTRQG